MGKFVRCALRWNHWHHTNLYYLLYTVIIISGDSATTHHHNTVTTSTRHKLTQAISHLSDHALRNQDGTKSLIMRAAK